MAVFLSQIITDIKLALVVKRRAFPWQCRLWGAYNVQELYRTGFPCDAGMTLLSSEAEHCSAHVTQPEHKQSGCPVDTTETLISSRSQSCLLLSSPPGSPQRPTGIEHIQRSRAQEPYQGFPGTSCFTESFHIINVNILSLILYLAITYKNEWNMA